MKVIGGADPCAVDSDGCEGVEAFAAENDVFLGKEVFLHFKGSAENPCALGQRDDLLFVVAREGVGDFSGVEEGCKVAAGDVGGNTISAGFVFEFPWTVQGVDEHGI